MSKNISLTLKNLELFSLDFKRTEATGEKSNFVTKSTLEIVEHTAEKVIIKNLRIFDMNNIEPFHLEFEVIGEFTGDNLTEKELKENLENISYPLLSKSSYIGAFITEQYLGYPFISPPSVEDGEPDEEVKDQE
ncbi:MULTISPECIES: hypothetical protein [Paenibacillus]|uniref:hypothetical protein n=1 Tax=Paenibacillus TaxID=44249 RepID=UPI00096D1848|nr:hypothetical protein [Paenibacillus odorifer]OMD10022.1 hypothetical protein BJP50_28930 [Paenibacillus odorifer]